MCEDLVNRFTTTDCDALPLSQCEAHRIAGVADTFHPCVWDEINHFYHQMGCKRGYPVACHPPPPPPGWPPPPPPPPSPPPPPLAPPPFIQSVLITVVAEGTVSDYDAMKVAELTTNMAATLGVPAATISLTISSASVILKFTVAVASVADAEAVKSTATQQLGTATAASGALGVTVVEDPVASASYEQSAGTGTATTPETVDAVSESSDDSNSTTMMTILGAVLGGLLLITALGFVFIVRREVQGRPVFQPILKNRSTGIDMTTAGRTSEIKADSV